MSMPVQVADGLWRIALPQVMPPFVHMGTHTTIVRLTDGTLLAHAPGAMTDELRRSVDALGEVSVLVAPNCYHHLHVQAWQAAYPAARAFIAPGLNQKRPDLPFAGVLGNAPSPFWEGVLEQHVVQGMPKLGEVVFFHAASRSLIVTDLVFNYQNVQHTWTRWLLTLYGAHNHFGPTRFAKALIDDASALRRSIEHIHHWLFDRILVAHGEPVTTNARAAFQRAFAFIERS